MRRQTIEALACAVLVFCGALTSAWTSNAEPPRAVPGKAALDYGFRFASAIVTDAKDQQKAQQAVVMEYAAIGLLDEATRLATSIEGWRRGAALADLANLLAKQGRKQDARALLEQAEGLRNDTPGWEGPRIAAHVAQAHAALGEGEASRKIGDELASADPRQYTGRAAAIAAAARAAEGDFVAAMGSLAAIDGVQDLEDAWWRTTGYLGLAREKRLDAADRRRALDAARHSADGLAGWKQAEALESIAEEYRGTGALDRAREALEVAAQRIEALPETDELKPALVSNLARALALSGDTERVKGLLAAAEAAVPRVLNLDRPALYANIASSWKAVGDEGEMGRLYEKAFETAEALENPRPRALAVVEICRSLGRNRIELTPRMRERLDDLLAGLKGS